MITGKKFLAKDKNVSLDYKLAPGLPKVDIDEQRILQVLMNLVDNAIKFTAKDGSVLVSVCFDDDENPPHMPLK